MHLNPKNFPKNLKRLRKQAKLSQRALAEKAGLGVTYVWNLEQARSEPCLDGFVRIANALNVEPKALLK